MEITQEDSVTDNKDGKMIRVKSLRVNTTSHRSKFDVVSSVQTSQNRSSY